LTFWPRLKPYNTPVLIGVVMCAAVGSEWRREYQQILRWSHVAGTGQAGCHA